MNVDKKTTKVALVSLAIALVWSTPSIKAVSIGTSTPTETVISVLIRTVIVFAFVRLFLSIAGKKK